MAAHGETDSSNVPNVDDEPNYEIDGFETVVSVKVKLLPVAGSAPVNVSLPGGDRDG